MSDGPARLKDLLSGATKKLGLKAPVETARVWSEWSRIVGAGVAGHAEPTSLKKGVLRIRADSPTWATEISYLASDIRTKVNAHIGSSLVHKVEVWTGPKPGPSARAGKTMAPSEASTGAGIARPSGARENDPQRAFERARNAWSDATRKGRAKGRGRRAENLEKPW